MTPPGLTCARCERALYPILARFTDDGWAHANHCRVTCSVDGCITPRHTRLHCSSHHQRFRRYGDPLAAGRQSLAPLEVEDVEWMVETGECLTGACRRLGRSVDALQKALTRLGRRDLYRALAAREGEWNTPGRMNQKVVA